MLVQNCRCTFYESPTQTSSETSFISRATPRHQKVIADKTHPQRTLQPDAKSPQYDPVACPIFPCQTSRPCLMCIAHACVAHACCLFCVVTCSNHPTKKKRKATKRLGVTFLMPDSQTAASATLCTSWAECPFPTFPERRRVKGDCVNEKECDLAGLGFAPCSCGDTQSFRLLGLEL